MEVISFYDIANLKRVMGKVFKEKSLSIFFVVPVYWVESNRKAGDGHPDIRIIPNVQDRTVAINRI